MKVPPSGSTFCTACRAPGTLAMSKPCTTRELTTRDPTRVPSGFRTGVL